MASAECWWSRSHTALPAPSPRPLYSGSRFLLRSQILSQHCPDSGSVMPQYLACDVRTLRDPDTIYQKTLGLICSHIYIKTRKYFYINKETKGFYQLEIIISFLVDSFCFLLIPIMWVYGHCKYVILPVWGSTLDVRFWRLKSAPALKGFNLYNIVISDAW